MEIVGDQSCKLGFTLPSKGMLLYHTRIPVVCAALFWTLQVPRLLLQKYPSAAGASCNSLKLLPHVVPPSAAQFATVPFSCSATADPRLWAVSWPQRRLQLLLTPTLLLTLLYGVIYSNLGGQHRLNTTAPQASHLGMRHADASQQRCNVLSPKGVGVGQALCCRC